jgi:hypothetical protein
MKKIIFFLLTILFAVTSCDDFLDTEVLTSKSSENYPSTLEEANQMLTGIYSQLLFQDPEVSSQYFVAELASDECLGGSVIGSNAMAANLMKYTTLNTFGGFSEGENWVPGVWQRNYKLIYRANVALAAYENFAGWSSDAEKNRYLGETYFLRAYAFNELTQMFGDVPLRTGTDMSYMPRASVDEVYELIASDLKNAIELMPAQSYLGNSTMAGHATKYAAEAMMARVFLFYTGRYDKTELPGGISKQQVIEWIDDCVDHSGHRLVSDQRNIWSYSNDVTEENDNGYRYDYVVSNGLHWEGLNCDETLFAYKHNLQSDWTYTWWCNTVAQFFSPSGDDMDKEQSYPFGQGWGAGPVSPAFVKEWKDWSGSQTYINPGQTEDPRLTGSIWSCTVMNPNVKGQVLIDAKLTPDEPDYTVSKRYCEQTGYFEKKYINVLAYDGSFRSFGLVMYPDIASNVASQSQSLSNIADFITIRFADVLLMQSELKQDAEGLNKVRARSGLAPVAYSLGAIQNERRYELAFEGIRWFDLLRWSGPSLDFAGQALNKQKGFDIINEATVKPMPDFDYAARLKETQGYWYIPQNEIDLSNGLIEQNPGWGQEGMYTAN